ncbi:VhaM9.7-d [Drosophila busckii]|uniref:VhaM9.7-d n=1 Tax=Drosophila busckii TaxID=30019 RepID=A0A0M4EKT8_DROBS|nr:VhaM9.7-d [Drosophila busckii]
MLCPTLRRLLLAPLARYVPDAAESTNRSTC